MHMIGVELIDFPHDPQLGLSGFLALYAGLAHFGLWVGSGLWILHSHTGLVLYLLMCEHGC